MKAKLESHDASRIWAWLPLGLWCTSTLALLRSALVSELIQLRATPADASELAIQTWELAGVFPEALLGALVIGLLSAAVAQRAAHLPPKSRFGGLVHGAFVFVATNSFVSGWIGEPSWTQARSQSGHLFSHQSFVAAACFFLTAFLFHFSRAVERRNSTRRFLSGPLAASVAFILGLLMPAGWLWFSKRVPPRFAERQVAHEFLAHPDTWVVTPGAGDLRPSVAILTPAVAQETDSGDKPALLLPLGSQVEMAVPADATDCVLRAAAAVDKSVRGQMPQGLDAIEVEFEILLDGQSVFLERIRSERLKEGVYAPESWTWRHAGGGAGLAVQPSSRLTFSARALDPTLLSNLPQGYPKVGFGGMYLERERQRQRTRPSADHPNIILIVMDTLRADRMSCYGHGRITTPHLDRLAERGLLYENAYATASWTWPSTASILTGLDPEVHGVLSQEQCTLQLLFETLPEVLQQAGYTTHGVSCNPLIAPERYFDQGFESFVPPPKQHFRKSDEVMPEIVRWVRSHRATRFFLYLHLVDPHTPHHPHAAELERLELSPPPDFPEQGMDYYNALLQKESQPVPLEQYVPIEHQRWISEQYDASVATGDRWVGVLLQTLQELDLEDDTLIAFTADHGEELFDHNLLEHGHTIYDELVRVPLILAGPGVAPGRRENAVVSLRDLAPTLARVAHCQLSQAGDAGDLLSPSAQGIAQFQTFKGVWLTPESPGPGRWLKRQKLTGLRQGALSLHWREDPASPLSGDVALYDYALDPHQTENRAKSHVEESHRLHELLQKRLESQRARCPDVPIGSSASVEALLHAIGYSHSEEEND